VLSNCGAICDRQVTIDPPFYGFDAAGSGDGYAPLLYGDDEIWAVNHHANNKTIKGDIVCMDRDTEAQCTPTGLWSLSAYFTPTWPVELLSNNHDKIYLGATRRSDRAAGLACFDVAARAWCGTEFVSLFDATGRDKFGSMVAGVWEYEAANEIWLIADTGQMACLKPDMSLCTGGAGTGIWDSAVSGNLGTTTANRTAWGEIVGDKLYLSSRNNQNKAFMHCFDLSTRSSCWSGTGYFNTGQKDTESMGFLRYAAGGGALEGFCITSRDHGNTNATRHKCVDFNGVELPALPYLTLTLQKLGGNWKGSAFVWNGERVLFGGGKSDRVSCYDMANRQDCGFVNATALSGGVTVEPYAFAQVTNECLVGLGDESVFFSVSPKTLTPCTDTGVATALYPCACADGSTRWGQIELPASLMAKVATLEFTAYTDASLTTPLSAELTNVDVVATGGIIDLSSVPASNAGPLHVEFVVGAAFDGAGNPLWTEPEVVDFKLTVKPTLVG